MRRIKVLKNFLEFVSGTGIVVGNAARPATDMRKGRDADVVSLPDDKAEVRVRSGYAEYADDGSDSEAEPTVRRKKTQRERRLEARAARRTAKAQEPAVADGGLQTGDSSDAPLPPVEEGPYEAKHIGGGTYEITGPDDFSEKVKGKHEAAARVDELNASVEEAAEGDDIEKTDADTDAPAV